MISTKCSWDEVLLDELRREWKNITTTLNDVSPYFEFSRKSVNASDAAEFIIFTYASPDTYGFVIYCCLVFVLCLARLKWHLSLVKRYLL